MENRNIIIMLLVVIAILAVAIGVMMFNQSHAKEATKIKITSDKEQYEGGKLSVELKDLNGTALSKEVVNVTVTDKKGKVVVDDVVKTNSKGKAKLDLDLKKGKYNVTVTYGGNENYTGTNSTQKLSIKEKVTEAVKPQSSSSQSSSHRQEYDITPDGWNPREHEVSREPIGDGNERVKYDDGYMRVVDKDGNVISHGFA
jgi:ABC-type Na+ efflux pump permease subunit